MLLHDSGASQKLWMMEAFLFSDLPSRCSNLQGFDTPYIKRIHQSLTPLDLRRSSQLLLALRKRCADACGGTQRESSTTLPFLSTNILSLADPTPAAAQALASDHAPQRETEASSERLSRGPRALRRHASAPLRFVTRQVEPKLVAVPNSGHPHEPFT